MRVRDSGSGAVLIGVSGAGEAVSVVNHNRLKVRVLSTSRSVDPPIGVEVESLGDVMRVVVQPQNRQPYSFGGRFFVRDGASSRQMSNAEVEDLFCAAGRLHFDRMPCADFSMESDLEDETWARFSRRAKIPEAMDRLVALRNLGLVVDDRMAQAGAWLLAPTRPSSAARSRGPLLADLAEAIAMVRSFLDAGRAPLDDVIGKQGFARNAAIVACKEAANENDETRKRFEVLCREVFRKFRACVNVRGVNAHRGDDRANLRGAAQAR